MSVRNTFVTVGQMGCSQDLSDPPWAQGGPWLSHQVGLQVSQALPQFGDPHPTEMSWSTVSWGHPACFAVAIPGKFPAPAIVERPQRAGGFSLFRATIL